MMVRISGMQNRWTTQITLLLVLCLLSVFLTTCADLQAPVREFPAEEWQSPQNAGPHNEWEYTPLGAIEILIVERGAGKGTFGHAAIHVGRYAYSWDYDRGYVLVKQTFRAFLKHYTEKYNRHVKGIMIEFTNEAIQRLVLNLDEEVRRAWGDEKFKRRSFVLTSNCSTILYRELLKASGRKMKGWPPTVLPSWMGKNVQRAFPLMYYTNYEEARP